MSDGPDYSRIKAAWANSKMQTENNAAYQSVLMLIDGVKAFQDFVQTNFIGTTFGDELNRKLTGLTSISLVNVFTSGSPQTVSLDATVGGMTVYKDIEGNAAVNNITLVGNVEGVVNPVINTNYGFYHVFRASDGSFHTW